MYTREVHF